MTAPTVRCVADLLAGAARDAGDLVALRGPERSLTYAELHTTVGEAAAAWQAHGLRPGDRVAVWSANTVDSAVAMLSVIVAGGVLVPLNPRYTVTEVGELLPRVACRYLVAADRVAGRPLAVEVLAIADDAQVVTLGDEVPPGTVGWRELSDRGRGRRAPQVQPGEIAAIQFTSGTTGRPKGALLRQAAMLSTAWTWAQVVGLSRGDGYPVLYPLAHVGGFKTGIISAIHARATITLVPVVSARSVVELVRAGGISVLNAPPTAQSYVVEACRTGEIPGDLGIRTAVLGSAVAPPELVRGLIEHVGVGDVVIGYGLTEATGVCTMTRRSDPVELVCSTIGRPIDGVEVRICPAAATANPGEPVIGEIEVRGENVMAGYLDDPQATAEAMHDDWLRTGDLGWIGEDGYVRIAGRCRDMVIVGGFNVYPVEIEHTLLEHPGVAEAAVIGVPDPRLGEVTAAFVVADGVDVDNLVDWCRQRLANFKVPRHVWLVDQLPRNSVGKVVKGALTEQAAVRLDAR